MAQCDRKASKAECKNLKTSCDKGTSCKGMKKEETKGKDKCLRSGNCNSRKK